jgi:hypothetical protein
MLSMTISASVSLLGGLILYQRIDQSARRAPAPRTTDLTFEVFAQVECCFGDLVGAVMTGRPRNRHPRSKVWQISDVQAEHVHMYEVREGVAEPRVNVGGRSSREQVAHELVGDVFDERPCLFSPSRRKPPLDGAASNSVKWRIAGDQRKRRVGASPQRARTELRAAEAVVAQHGSYVALAGYGDGRRAVRQLDIEGRLSAKEVDMFRRERRARTGIER